MRERGQSQSRKSSTPRPWVELCELENRSEEITQNIAQRVKEIEHREKRLKDMEHSWESSTYYS